jgi:hypothetical protein
LPVPTVQPPRSQFSKRSVIQKQKIGEVNPAQRVTSLH